MGGIVAPNFTSQRPSGPIQTEKAQTKKRPETENDKPRDPDQDKNNLQKALERQRKTHELYVQLTGQLTLSDEHRQLLKEKRGLTDDQVDELDRLWFPLASAWLLPAQ